LELSLFVLLQSQALLAFKGSKPSRPGTQLAACYELIAVLFSLIEVGIFIEMFSQAGCESNFVNRRFRSGVEFRNIFRVSSRLKTNYALG
jgi:hypothetical protein